uniref:Ribosome biogenesis protein Alb1 n=1 Tax=Globodera pallida TaxID=36090 RepID=A0A183BTM7_GLOPA
MSTSNARVSTADPELRAQLQAKAKAAAKKLYSAAAVKSERRRLSAIKPDSAARRGWKESVKKTNADLSGKSLPKPPTPSPEKLARSKLVSWGRFELKRGNPAAAPAPKSMKQSVAGMVASNKHRRGVFSVSLPSRNPEKGVEQREKTMEELLWDELEADSEPVYGEGEQREEGEMWEGDESE